MASIARIGPKIGKKKVFLPNFTLTLLKTPNLPPTFATFIVPLNINKLDIRDYLYHLYNMEVRSVRSYIQQQKVRKPTANHGWFRPRSIKKMIVEMHKPFVWPEIDEDWLEEEKSALEERKKYQQEHERQLQRGSVQVVDGDRNALKEQAKEFLGRGKSGKRKQLEWRGTTVWDDVEGGEREVDEDVDLEEIDKQDDGETTNGKDEKK